MNDCTHSGVRPDPGRDVAITLVVAHFDTPSHHRRADASRSCLGCGYYGPSAPGSFECHGGGPSLKSWCSACFATIWEYRIPWDRWYRMVERPENQLVLAL